MAFRVAIKRTSLVILGRRRDLALFEIVNLNFGIRVGSALRVSTTVDSLAMRDLATANSLFPNIVVPQRDRDGLNDAEQEPFFRLTFEVAADGHTYKIGLNMDPLQIVYNARLFHQISSFFSSKSGSSSIQFTEQLVKDKYDELKTRTM